jgi:hypothetical protein
MKHTQEDKTQSLEMLHAYLKPGDTVYTILRHVSRSGMQRKIDLIVISDGKPYFMSYHAAVVLDMPHTDNGITINGCGMDMGFNLVYRLSSAMWPEGTKKPHSTRNGEPDKSGGYALKQRWL